MAEYSQDERRQLLALARQAVAAAFNHHSPDLNPPSEHLAEQRGAFTTLHLEGNLRGCVGHIFPQYSLYRTVAETARAAAFNDPRFLPLAPLELPKVDFEISVLTPLQPIDAEDIEVGKHGLLVTYAGRRGLLLPQVPLEYEWDREMFLQQTCVKAGIPRDAWQHGAKLEAFTAEIFSEHELQEKKDPGR